MRSKINRTVVIAVIWICTIGMLRAWGADQSRGKQFLYVSVGNSITYHSICRFWFYNCGMGASKPSRDYVHKTISGLKKAYGEEYSVFRRKTVQASAWETDRSERKMAEKEIERLLKKKPQLFTFMFGEGFRNTYMVEEDLTSLVRLIQEKSPETAIVLIGNFMRNTDIRRKCDAIKRRVARKCNVAYVDLSPIAGQSDYQLGFTDLYDSKGKKHRVKLKLVAKHPNDRGMAYIAEKVLTAYEDEVKKAEAAARDGSQKGNKETKKQQSKKQTTKKKQVTNTNKVKQKKGHWKTVRKKGHTYRQYYDENGNLIKGKAGKPKIKKIGTEKYAFDQRGYILTGVQVIREKLFYFTKTGKLHTKKTAALRAVSRQEQEIGPLKKILSDLGCPLKKEVYYSMGCRALGVDGSLFYPGFEISVFRYDDGRIVVISIFPTK